MKLCWMILLNAKFLRDKHMPLSLTVLRSRFVLLLLVCISVECLFEG